MNQHVLVAPPEKLTSTVHPNGRATEHEDISDGEPSQEELDGFLDAGDRNNNQAGQGSQTMSRGWSGNTGPKGVLLDFKASHGKSGAILGGNGVIPSYSRQAVGSKSPMITHSRSCSSPPSDSGSSGRSETSLSIDNALYASIKTTTRLNPPKHHQRASTSSSGSTSHLNQKNIKLDPSGRKLFGHLREVGVANFVHAIQAEKDDPHTVVLVHLYDPALESCVVLNNHLSNLARSYPRTKFLRALASEVDFFSTSQEEARKSGKFTTPSLKERSPASKSGTRRNLMDANDPFADEDGWRNENEVQGDGASPRATDTDILPTLIWYRSGLYVQSLPALESHMPAGSILRGEKGCKDLETLLKRNGIIHSS